MERTGERDTEKKQKQQRIGKMILFAIFVLGLMVYLLLPSLRDFRNSIYGSIVLIALIGAAILYVTLSKKIAMHLLGKITLWAYLVVLIVQAAINLGRIEAIFSFVYAVGNVVVATIMYKTKKKGYKEVYSFGLFAYLTTATISIRTHFSNDDWWLTIIIPAIPVGVVVAVLCLLFQIKKYKNGGKRENLICIPLCGLFVGFVFTYLTLASMNVYLDTSAPTYEEFVITDKDIHSGAKRVTTYELDVQRGGTTFTINVSNEAYYDYEVGDTITLSIYGGAFNEPYYIYEEGGK